MYFLFEYPVFQLSSYSCGVNLSIGIGNGVPVRSSRSLSDCCLPVGLVIEYLTVRVNVWFVFKYALDCYDFCSKPPPYFGDFFVIFELHHQANPLLHLLCFLICFIFLRFQKSFWFEKLLFESFLALRPRIQINFDSIAPAESPIPDEYALRYGVSTRLQKWSICDYMFGVHFYAGNGLFVSIQAHLINTMKGLLIHDFFKNLQIHIALTSDLKSAK
jgi:hypothetical protein